MDAIKQSTDQASVTSIGKDMRADLHQAIDKAADQAQPMADRLAVSAHKGVDQVGDTVNDVSGSLLARGKQLGAAYNSAAETGRTYVRTSPAISILVAMAAGYGLSKLIAARK